MNEIVKINASDYGLEESKASEIKAMFMPMLEKMEELEKEYNEILQLPIDTGTCILAKELRLSYVKTRTATEKIHKELKAFYLSGGRFVDAFKNTQSFASGEKEKILKAIEDHFENIEKERIEKLRAERLKLLQPYTDIEPMQLGNMEQSVFDNYLAGMKLSYEQKIAAEKLAEEKRLADIEAERIRQENIRLENERLKKEAEEKEKALLIERERIRKENEEKERLAEIERKKNAEILKAQQEKAAKEKAELLAKAEVERKEKERLGKEIADMKLADEKAKQDEIKRQKDAEKKAKLAPDKTKLLNFMQAISDLPRPEVLSIEAVNIATNANTLLIKVATYIKENANKL